MIEDIFRFKVSRCLDLLEASLKGLSSRGEEAKIEANEYYRLRNQVREAKVIFEEIKKEARRLFGPPPPYASSDFEKLRQESLEKSRLIIKNQEKEKIAEEFLQDELIIRYFQPDEVRLYIENQFESQRKGKRKLANFKARLFLERIKRDLERAEDLVKSIKNKVDLF